MKAGTKAECEGTISKCVEGILASVDQRKQSLREELRSEITKGENAG
jgi:hypothetical protein